MPGRTMDRATSLALHLSSAVRRAAGTRAPYPQLLWITVWTLPGRMAVKRENCRNLSIWLKTKQVVYCINFNGLLWIS